MSLTVHLTLVFFTFSLPWPSWYRQAHSIKPTFPKLPHDTWHERGSFREVGDMSRGSRRRHGLCYGEVTGIFRGFKPSRHVEMVWRIFATSRQPAVCGGNGQIGDVADKSTGMSRFSRADLSWTSWEVGIVEFELYHRRSEAGIVFSSVCMWLWLSVCLSTRILMNQYIITKFLWHHATAQVKVLLIRDELCWPINRG